MSIYIIILLYLFMCNMSLVLEINYLILSYNSKNIKRYTSSIYQKYSNKCMTGIPQNISGTEFFLSQILKYLDQKCTVCYT